ncbi:hypothetical protein ACP70R_018369 [Stipagrostis hirtigluma subsp. patula]
MNRRIFGHPLVWSLFWAIVVIDRGGGSNFGLPSLVNPRMVMLNFLGCLNDLVGEFIFGFNVVWCIDPMERCYGRQRRSEFVKMSEEPRSW